MSKAFTSKRLQLALATWAEETSNPSAGAGVAAEIGSYWQRAGVPGTSPTETYLKTGAADTAWTKQNTVNMNVFRVTDFGAVADSGVTDNRVAFNACLQACIAAGGGICYIPAAAGFYGVVKEVGAGKRELIDMLNAKNITWMGDGYASQVRQVGTVARGETHLFGCRGDVKRLRFENFYIDVAAITEQEEQNHAIQVYGSSAIVGEPDDVEVDEMYFGRIVGDCVRLLGEENREVTNVRSKYSSYNLYNGVNASRGALVVQRHTRRIIFLCNWILGGHDQSIDFEPTGIPITGPQGAPTDYVIYGILCDGRDQTSQTFTLSGQGGLPFQASLRNIVAYCQINNANDISAVNGAQLTMRGNIVDWTGGLVPLNDGGVYDFHQDSTWCKVESNIGITINSAEPQLQHRGVSFKQQNGLDPKYNVVVNNILRTKVTTNSGQSNIFNADLIEGNICTQDATQSGVSGAVTAHPRCIGNLLISEGARWLNAITAGTDSPNAVFNYNCGVGLMSVFARFLNPGPYPQAQCTGNWSQGTNSSTISNSTRSTIHKGNAPGALWTVRPSSAGPNGSQEADVGSIGTNSSGNQNAAFFYKEDGTGDTGWVGWGETEISMGALSGDAAATANRFLAPGGMGLAVESATEIQFAVPRACRFRNLRMVCVAGTGGGNNTFRVRKNGADTALQFTVANTATGGTDTTNSFTAVAGDLISVRDTKTALPATPQTRIQVTIGCV